MENTGQKTNQKYRFTETKHNPRKSKHHKIKQNKTSLV